MTEQATLSAEWCADGTVIVRMDDKAEELNTLKLELAREFDLLLDKLENDKGATSLVFISAKPNNFLAGANLDMLRDVATPADGEALSRLAQGIQDRIERLSIPTVVAINGACLGGGLELALAFDVRVASDASTTRLGLPEVQLGLLPGGGGTQRLPRLIGVAAALDLLLTGREVNVKRARSLGLVDHVVATPDLLKVATELGVSHPKRGRPVKRPAQSLTHRTGLMHWLMSANPLGRKLTFDKALQRTRATTKGHYPAPERILQVVHDGLRHGMVDGLAAEARAFGELLQTSESRQLIGLFFASNELKKDAGVDDPNVRALPVSGVGILGAGLMGAGIAYVSSHFAQKTVVVKDRDEDSARRGLAYVEQRLNERVARGRMTKSRRDATFARITPSGDYAGLRDVDIVIEAVFEDLQLKRQMINDIETHGGLATIFASNTSSIPIADIARGCARPENVIGMHYFSPVERMPLLEVIVTRETQPQVVATCVALGKEQKKTVIVVRDGPGFYTSRILAPYMNEAAWLLAEGWRIDEIDRALVAFGFPIGPLTLLDEVGIDVADKVAGLLQAAFGERMRPPALMDTLKNDDRLGKKNARGMYIYDGEQKGDAKRPDQSVYELLGLTDNSNQRRESEADIAERCVLQMVNEAARCLQEGILRNARDGDIGAVFGLGFPPFRGGPFRYADSIGVAAVVARLNTLCAQHGERFAPAALLESMVESGESFYT